MTDFSVLWKPSLCTLLPSLLKDSTAQVIFPDAWGDFCGQEVTESMPFIWIILWKDKLLQLVFNSIQGVKDSLFTHKCLLVFLLIQGAELSFGSYRCLEDVWRTQSLYFGFCLLFIFPWIYLVWLFRLSLYHSNFFFSFFFLKELFLLRRK